MTIDFLLEHLDGNGLVITDMDLIEQALEDYGLDLTDEIGKPCPDCDGVLKEMTADEVSDAHADNVNSGIMDAGTPHKRCGHCGYVEYQ